MPADPPTYYAVFYTPGSLNARHWSVPIPSADPLKVKWPKDAFMFRLFQAGTDVQLGKDYYHPDSKVETLTDVEKNPRAPPGLVDTMKSKGWNQILWSRWGTWPQPWDPGKGEVLQSKSGKGTSDIRKE